jgi:hypothetical protein
VYYSNGFPNSYEELKTFYPIFYLDVFEMDELLRAYGKIADGIAASIELVINNNFIMDADEQTITRLERFLFVEIDRTKTLDERKRIVLSLFVGFGKISASKIKEMVDALTDSDSVVDFKVIDEHGNNAVTITVLLTSASNLGLADVHKVLSRKIPAHLVLKYFAKCTQTALKRFTHAQLRQFTHKQLGSAVPLEEVMN